MASKEQVIESIYEQMKDPAVTQEEFENLGRRLAILQGVNDK